MAGKLTEQDMARIAADLQAAGKKLADEGSRTLFVLGGWAQGVSSASLEPSGAEASDPTALAVLGAEGRPMPGPDLLGGLHAEFEHELAKVHASAVRLRDLMFKANPTPAVLSDREQTAAQAAVEGWCRSCWRVGQHLEPVAMHKGERLFRDYCNWCGRFMAEHKQILKGHEPPLELVEAHVSGRRITVSMVAAAFVKLPKQKKTKKPKGKAA